MSLPLLPSRLRPLYTAGAVFVPTTVTCCDPVTPMFVGSTLLAVGPSVVKLRLKLLLTNTAVALSP